MEKAVHRTEMERDFLANKGFNTNLVHFLPPYHVIISNMHVCSYMGTISHIHQRAVFRARKLTIIIYEGMFLFYCNFCKNLWLRLKTVLKQKN